MAQFEEIPIKGSFPFLRRKKIVFIGSKYGLADSCVERNIYHVRVLFQHAGYTFLYIPDLLSELSPFMIRFLFPEAKEGFSPESFYERIDKEAGLGGRAGFLYKKGRKTFFHPVPEDDPFLPEEDIFSFGEFLYREYAEIRRAPSLMPEPVLAKETADSFERPAPKERVPSRKEVQKKPKKAESERDDIRFSIVGGDGWFQKDPGFQTLIKELKRFETEYGVTLRDLETFLNKKVKPCRLKITSSNKVFLIDLDEEPEVKMDDLSKTLYFFYLRHPEGVPFKNLQSYEGEILQIYLNITGRDDLDAIRKTVSDLVDPYSENRNPLVSRIKRRFKDILGESLSQPYCIGGKSGGIRKIALDRDYVIWSH